MSQHSESEQVALPIDQDEIRRMMTELEDHSVNLVTLQFSDIAGGGRTVTIPASILPRVFKRGFRFDGSAVSGGVRQVEVDLFLAPDPSTLIVLPDVPDQPRRAHLFCWVTRRAGQEFSGDPRTILQRLLQKAAAMGLDYRVGVELEFYLYEGELRDGPNSTASSDTLGYFSEGAVRTAAVRDQIVSTMHELGLGVHGAHHETGPGQQELDLGHLGGIKIADQLTSTRQIIKQIAHQHGLRATFMAKPFLEAPGSGMHLFQRVLNLQTGADMLRHEDSRELTPLARHMIAGQLLHAPAMSAVLNTTVNSYKRLSDGHRAPAWATWAHVSGGSLLRVPATPAGTLTNIELRSPDPLANPYLAIAVALGSALKGIEKELEPPAPFDENLVQHREVEFARLGVERLPQTLGEALDRFAQDDTMQDILGHYIVDQLLAVKRAEWADYRRHVSPWELAKYGEL